MNPRLGEKAGDDVRCFSRLVLYIATAKMSAMSKKEVDGCRNLLKLLSEDDVLALNDTVTNRLIPVASSRGKTEKLVSIPDCSASSVANFAAT